jgi:hypothetical protein
MKLLLLVSALALSVGACNVVGFDPSNTPEPTLSVQGTYTDENGNTVTLGPENVYVHQPNATDSHWYEVDTSFTLDQTAGGYLIAQNRSNLGQANELGDMETVFNFSRFDWQLFMGDLYYCHTVDNAPDATIALQSTDADHSVQSAGCRGSHWLSLTKS